MERQFSSYEALFVVDLDIGDESVKAIIEKFKGMIEQSGKIVRIDDWGKRRLAYPINDKNDGYYSLITFDAPADLPAEINRVAKITEGVMRAMVLKAVAPTAKAPAAIAPASDEAAPAAPAAEVEAPAAEAAEAPAAEAAEAPAAEAAEAPAAEAAE